MTNHPRPTDALDPQLHEAWRERFDGSRELRNAQNAVARAGIDQVSRNIRVVAELGHTMSERLDDWKVTDQKRSGRCWLFAATNLLRSRARKALGVKNFELSQNYLFFYDKLERANFFFDRIAHTSELPLTDRLVSHLIGSVFDDGGQWDMVVNLVEKYGLVPVTAMPETYSSGNSDRMNGHLVSLARQGAKLIREQVAAGVDTAELGRLRERLLSEIHDVLSIHLGTPPASFDWQWTDDEKVFHRRGSLTPQQFRDEFVGVDLADYVCIVDDPRREHPIGSMLQVAHLGNVVEGRPVRYLNLGIDALSELSARAISDGEPVWFGCDCDAQADDETGLWHEALMEPGPVYGLGFELDKGDRLRYGDSAMVHAMLFTGVDLVDGRPRAWRVENSWGKEKAKDGFHTMSEGWFREYVFEAVIHRDRLTDAQRAALDADPIMLDPWDPMGMLA